MRERAAARTGGWLADLWSRIDAARGGPIDVETFDAEHVRLRLERGKGQGPPHVLATLTGTARTATYGVSPAELLRQGEPRDVVRTFEVVQHGNRYLVSGVRGATDAAPATVAAKASFRLTDVAASVGPTSGTERSGTGCRWTHRR